MQEAGTQTPDRDAEPQSARGKAGVGGNAAMSVGPPGKLQTGRIGRSFDTRSLVGVLVVLLFCGLALYFHGGARYSSTYLGDAVRPAG